jgi:hypothetical protein
MKLVPLRSGRKKTHRSWKGNVKEMGKEMGKEIGKELHTKFRVLTGGKASRVRYNTIKIIFNIS